MNKPNKEKFFIPKLVTFSVTNAADDRADAAKFDPVSRPPTPPALPVLVVLVVWEIEGPFESMGPFDWFCWDMCDDEDVAPDTAAVSKPIELLCEERTDDWNDEFTFGCFNWP